MERLLGELPRHALLEAVSEICFALSDPMRVKVVLALAVGELCVSDLAGVLGSTVPNASVHLRRLREARIVVRRAEGKMIFYSLPPDGVAPAVIAMVSRYAEETGRTS